MRERRWGRKKERERKRGCNVGDEDGRERRGKVKGGCKEEDGRVRRGNGEGD